MPTLDVPLSTVMTRDVVTVLSTATVEQAVRAMLEQNVLGLAVEDAAGSVVGVFSMTDALWATSTSERSESDDSFYDAAALLRIVREPKTLEAKELPVSRFMNQRVVSLGPDATVAEAARTMAERRIHRVLVLDEKKKLLGVVAALDVCRHVTS
ncbi:MAG: CBS domain-containing protein [Myxococcales bacterium]|nr:CBS domain-containing protein [Myxococcales bacterium]MCB9578404.1 CBS domain-containing protein [Polyangiaceae bacterium]